MHLDLNLSDKQTNFILTQKQMPIWVTVPNKPNYSYLRSFGCLYFSTILKIHKDKFESKSIPRVFVGYPFGTKGYKVLDLATKKIHVSRDVIFYENVFSFAGSVVFVTVYVDDFLITWTHRQEIECLKAFLHDTIKIKNLGRLHYFLGLEIQYRDNGVLISQRKFNVYLLK